METACKRAGLEWWRLHDFRRTAAREFVNAGVPEKVAMQIVGWKSRTMLDRYYIVNERDVANALAKRYGKQAASKGLARPEPPKPEYHNTAQIAKLSLDRHRSSVVELSIRSPARPAHASAGRCVFKDFRDASAGQRRPATAPLAPPLAPHQKRVWWRPRTGVPGPFEHVHRSRTDH